MTEATRASVGAAQSAPARYSRTPMSLKTAISALCVLALGVGIAGCGGSTKAPGVTLAPSGGRTVETVSSTSTTSTTPSSTSSSTSTTPAAVSTPTSGPLSKEPTIKIPSGSPPKKLVVKDLIKGKGTAVKSGDQISVNYVGALYSNGKVFDASWKDTPGKAFGPFQIGVGAVIKGWDQGLIGMKVGGRRELIIPPSLAYGAAGQAPSIPKNATLVFIVDLLKIGK